jgi:hypothetical protein
VKNPLLPWGRVAFSARAALLVALVIGTCSCASASTDQIGIRYVGRWLPPTNAPTATYEGSMVIFRFMHSSTLSADLSVMNSKGDQPLYISVRIDGGKPIRIALSRGEHPGVMLASGLTDQLHRVTLRKEGEPWFGALQVSNPKLAVAGRWQTIEGDRPIIEVIGDSDATGICALGPDSPADGVSIWNSSWASEASSWVGQLESGLAAVGHPADVVDLAISGSKTVGEADTYDDTAPDYSDAKFDGYWPPGRPHASLVFMWGGGNDRHAGGDVASKSPVTYATLSRYQKGVYDLLKKIFGQNPDVHVVMLQYIDPTIPDWTPAIKQVRSLFSEDEQRRIFDLLVYDPKGTQDACEADPEGHPNLYLHSAWAAQILLWMNEGDRLQQLGFSNDEEWNEP